MAIVFVGICGFVSGFATGILAIRSLNNAENARKASMARKDTETHPFGPLGDE